MVKCIHLVPADGVGGVEVAARSYIRHSDRSDRVELKVMYLANAPAGSPDTAESARFIASGSATINAPRAYLSALRTLARERPSILVCSLWRTMLVGLMWKLISPHVRLVCFLHTTRSVHLVDRVLNDLAMLLAKAIWSDSEMTLELRIPQWLKKRKRLRTVSFILEKHKQEPLPDNAPSFVFWGRLHHVKGVDRALRLIAALAERHPDTRYYIFGPDGGEEGRLRALAGQLGIAGRVAFMGTTSFEELKKTACRFSYYLQLSRFEGMAVSVVEAMQLGLVPVVCPVGEIANYCDGNNAVIVGEPEDPARYVTEIGRVLDDDALFRKLQKQSLQTWRSAVPYSSDILRALEEVEQG